MVVKTKPVGLYELIGGPKNGDLTLEDIEDFLTRNTLDPESRERLLAWNEEFKFWEKYAKIYVYMERGKHYRDLIKTMKSFIEPRPGEIWLDAGCGPAKMSELIWEKSEGKVKKIYGVDIVLSAAREKLAQLGNSIPLELKYVNLGERLPFSDNSFDGIISNNVLSYVIEFEGSRGKEGMLCLFKELNRVLRPGGQLIWSTPEPKMHSEIAFISSIPDIIRERRNLPSLSIAIQLLRLGLEVKKKSKAGIYTFLTPKEWNEVLEEGFVSLTWKFVFTHQLWVNKSIKPDIV